MPEHIREEIRRILERDNIPAGEPGEPLLLDHLPEDYLRFFTPEEIARQIEAVRKLTPEDPVTIISDPPHRITICTFDRRGLFSLLTGALGAEGFDILSGHVFTSEDAAAVAIDTFTGNVDRTDDWIPELEQALRSYLTDPDGRAREGVARAVADRVARANRPTSPALMPIRIIFESDRMTRISVESQDTSFFLYSLASALSFQGIDLRRVEITTMNDRISDTFWVTDRRGNPITDPETLDKLRVAILLTKEFTNALPQAADPFSAFQRFEELVLSVAASPAQRQLQELLANPEQQKELARLLGASTFLWEDFIRLQYESILPLLQFDNAHSLLSTASDELEAKLTSQLVDGNGYADRCRILNQFKDHEAYLIDADHILRRNNDFFFLSHRLTQLAELIVHTAFSLAWNHLTEEFGVPRTAGGLEAEYALFGLGKLGGRALGYASDLELLFVYGDHGETDAPERSVTNREFFERLVKEAVSIINTKRKGLFHVDLRLRPYGTDGPSAVHLETFVSYYGPGGGAHSVERLALIRLRYIGGSESLGRQVTEIRDQFLYETVDPEEIRDLRRRQIHEKVDPARLNAKLSPGALVDLEYNVQLLQIEHGRNNPKLRDPGIHATLRALSEAGTIADDEANNMIQAYRFLRNLINALRMLRGNADDLYLPATGTLEYVHLARRMGYSSTAELSAEEQMEADFQTQTAMVRTFVERHLGTEAIPGDTRGGNPADLILGDALSEEWSGTLLHDAGFKNPDRGVENLRRIAGSHQTLFARLLVLAWNYLRRSSDPDMALNNWERFVEQLPDRKNFFTDLMAQPRRMEIMFSIFSGSQFLSDTLIRNPAFLTWISDPAVITTPRTQQEIQAELTGELSGAQNRTDRLNRLRLFRKREILRIGTRDICLAGDFTETIAEISALARAAIQSVCNTISGDNRMTILAFGKLGGGELNYSSDIDLLAVYEPHGGAAETEKEEREYARRFKAVVRDLSDFSEEGRAYRVDLRLRPYGNAGRLVYTIPAALRYYEKEAELAELQALLKLAPVAGNLEIGRRFLEELRPIFTRRLHAAGRDSILATVRRLRSRAVTEYRTRETGDIKNGEGGIRDIEFLVQAEQMVHSHLFPGLFTGSTLIGLEKLEEVGIMDGKTAMHLKQDYILLRRIEHFLQVYDDRQLHAIPQEPQELRKLTAIVLGDEKSPDELRSKLEETIERVRGLFTAYTSGNQMS